MTFTMLLEHEKRRLVKEDDRSRDVGRWSEICDMFTGKMSEIYDQILYHSDTLD